VGSAAYPRFDSLVPGGPPLSTGFDRHVALRVRLTGGDMGDGAEVVDLGFLPAYRSVPGLTGSWPGCPSRAAARDAVLAGRAGDAARALPASFADLRSGTGFPWQIPAQNLFREVVRAEATALVRPAGEVSADVEDARQNL
jgi:hypothetical protein